MQLGKLRSAIRNHRGNIHVEALIAGRVLQIPVQKTPFLNETLPGVFGSDKSVETELEFEDGMVRFTGDDDIGTLTPEPEVYFADGPTGPEEMDDPVYTPIGVLHDDPENDPLGDLIGGTEVGESDAQDDDGFVDLLG